MGIETLSPVENQPVEILSSIIDYLDFGSIANLAGTSKKMHELIYGNSALLKYVLANKFGRPEHFNALSHEHLRIYLQTAIKYFSLVATIKTSSPPKTRFVSIVNIAVQGWHKIMGGKAASNERNQVVERIIFDPALNRSMFDLVTFCVENDLPILLKFIVNSHGKYFMPLLLSFNSFFDNQKDALSYRILEKISVLYLSALRKNSITLVKVVNECLMLKDFFISYGKKNLNLTDKFNNIMQSYNYAYKQKLESIGVDFFAARSTFIEKILIDQVLSCELDGHFFSQVMADLGVKLRPKGLVYCYVMSLSFQNPDLENHFFQEIVRCIKTPADAYHFLLLYFNQVNQDMSDLLLKKLPTNLTDHLKSLKDDTGNLLHAACREVMANKKWSDFWVFIISNFESILQDANAAGKTPMQQTMVNYQKLLSDISFSGFGQAGDQDVDMENHGVKRRYDTDFFKEICDYASQPDNKLSKEEEFCSNGLDFQ